MATLHFVLIYILLFWGCIAVVILLFGMCIVWKSKHEYELACNEERELAKLTCKLWCTDMRGKTQTWRSLAYFGAGEEVIGISIEPQVPGWVQLTARDETGASYRLHPTDELFSGVLYEFGFGEYSLKGLVVQSIVLTLKNTRTNQVVREYVWTRASHQHKRTPDPQVLALLKNRASMFGEY